MAPSAAGDRLDRAQLPRPSLPQSGLPASEVIRGGPRKRTTRRRSRTGWGSRIGLAVSAATVILGVLAACSDGTTSLRKAPGISSVLDDPHASSAAPSTTASTKDAPSAKTRPGPNESNAEPPDSTRSATPSAGSKKTTPKGKPEAVRLGDLNPPPDAATVGAPYDPCTVLGWDDFPTEVRPQAPRPRQPSPRAPSTFDIACAWIASGRITLSADGSSSGASGTFNTWVVWGKDMNAHPPNSTPTQFGPAQGSLVPDHTSEGTPMCTGFAALAAGGVAGVSTVNGTAPHVDTCGLVTDLLTRIVTKHN